MALAAADLMDTAAPVAARGQRRLALTYLTLAAALDQIGTGRRTVADGWPDDIEVQRVHVDFESDSVEVVVTSARFAPVASGHVIPYWTPIFRDVED